MKTVSDLQSFLKGECRQARGWFDSEKTGIDRSLSGSYIVLQCVRQWQKVLQYGRRRAEAYNKTTKKCSAQLAQIYDLHSWVCSNLFDLVYLFGLKYGLLLYLDWFKIYWWFWIKTHRSQQCKTALISFLIALVDGQGVKHLEKVVQLEIQTKCPGSVHGKGGDKTNTCKKRWII